MAGGFVYNAIDQTEVATAEIYGKALADLIMKDPKVPPTLQNPQNSATFLRFAPSALSTSALQSRICSALPRVWQRQAAFRSFRASRHSPR